MEHERNEKAPGRDRKIRDRTDLPGRCIFAA